MHVADSHTNSKKEGGLTGDWNRRGPLEVNHKPYQPPAHGSDLISQYAPRVSGGMGDRDRQPLGQASPTAY